MLAFSFYVGANLAQSPEDLSPDRPHERSPDRPAAGPIARKLASSAYRSGHVGQSRERGRRSRVVARSCPVSARKAVPKDATLVHSPEDRPRRAPLLRPRRWGRRPFPEAVPSMRCAARTVKSRQPVGERRLSRSDHHERPTHDSRQ